MYEFYLIYTSIITMNVFISTSHILKADREQGGSALDTGDEHSWLGEALASLIHFLSGASGAGE